MTYIPELTCAQLSERLADHVEPGDQPEHDRHAVEAHLAGCAPCALLVRDLRAITSEAAALPVLSPSRDLWQGIADRIATPVVELPTRGVVAPVAAVSAPAAVPANRSVRRALIAASLLVAATAGVTYSITSRALSNDASSVAAAGAVAGPTVTGPSVAKNVAAKHASAEETFDREIGTLRTIVEQRRGDLDSTTVATLERNLKLIDQAIAESKAALANDPASGFLMDRLTRAYDSKLQLLRGVATLPARGD
jgi:Tfp pilus assembly major pilin PilA